ncbi:MAG: transcriptional regulator GcvA [Alphaproteobacteria bacterium]|nr:transcriptional regulator GcvA [Alphaproteobacteria bacterium]
MPQTLLPPLNSLRAFEAAARHLSFARAADELNVTAAALSHQIKTLESFLDVKLFERKTRAVALTAAGEALYPGLHAAFGQIRQALASLESLNADQVLVISSPPGFTAKWLAPRIYRFLTAHPEIDARITSNQARANFTTDGVDIAIRNSLGPPTGLYFEKLADVRQIVVASPEYIERFGPFNAPADLNRATLIHDNSLGGIQGMPRWDEWFREAGAEMVPKNRGIHFNSADHSIDAAEEGAGVLLGTELIVADDLKKGRLVKLLDITINTPRAMYFVCPVGRENLPKIKAFREWLQLEIRAMECVRAAAA